jgi:hypothetical protein
MSEVYVDGKWVAEDGADQTPVAAVGQITPVVKTSQIVLGVFLGMSLFSVVAGIVVLLIRLGM